MSKTTNLPPMVSPVEWRAAHERRLAKKKAARRGRDALAAERRRQPMLGRQEREGSPEGWPQSASYSCWRHHAEFGGDAVTRCR